MRGVWWDAGGDALWLPNTERPAWLDGSMPGDRGFDPLGLAKPTEYLQVTARALPASYGMLLSAWIQPTCDISLLSEVRLAPLTQPAAAVWLQPVLLPAHMHCSNGGPLGRRAAPCGSPSLITPRGRVCRWAWTSWTRTRRSTRRAPSWAKAAANTKISDTALQPYDEVFGLQRFRETELIHGRSAAPLPSAACTRNVMLDVQAVCDTMLAWCHPEVPPRCTVMFYDVWSMRAVRPQIVMFFEVPDMRVRRWAMLATLGVIVAEASTGVSW